MRVSVILLSWNGMDDLGNALEALQAQSSSGVEIIVVDNASTDGSAEFVERYYPDVSLIRSPCNVGFAGGNNRGLEVATGKVLVLLNQDTIVRRGWLNALVAALAGNPRSGIVGAKALFPDGRIQHAGGFVDVRGSAARMSGGLSLRR